MRRATLSQGLGTQETGPLGQHEQHTHHVVPCDVVWATFGTAWAADTPCTRAVSNVRFGPRPCELQGWFCKACQLQRSAFKGYGPTISRVMAVGGDLT
jgi:hypothetical protein